MSNHSKKEYTWDDLVNDVRKEAKALKKHATEDEINGLDFERLNPINRRGCIYGQMVGDCMYPRAIELIQKCCKQYFDSSFTTEHPSKKMVLQNINGKRVNVADDRSFISIGHFSSIEAYILAASQIEKRKLISFLKGKREDII